MKVRYRILLTVYCAGLLAALCTPHPPDAVPPLPGVASTAHVVLFGGMAAIIALGLFRSNPAVSRWALWLAPVTAATAYGLFLECVQLYVPYRNFDWMDVAFDLLGAVLMQALFYFNVYRRESVPAVSGEGNPGAV